MLSLRIPSRGKQLPLLRAKTTCLGLNIWIGLKLYQCVKHANQKSQILNGKTKF